MYNTYTTKQGHYLSVYNTSRVYSRMAYGRRSRRSACLGWTVVSFFFELEHDADDKEDPEAEDSAEAEGEYLGGASIIPVVDPTMLSPSSEPGRSLNAASS